MVWRLDQREAQTTDAGFVAGHPAFPHLTLSSSWIYYGNKVHCQGGSAELHRFWGGLAEWPLWRRIFHGCNQCGNRNTGKSIRRRNEVHDDGGVMGAGGHGLGRAHLVDEDGGHGRHRGSWRDVELHGVVVRRGRLPVLPMNSIGGSQQQKSLPGCRRVSQDGTASSRPAKGSGQGGCHDGSGQFHGDRPGLARRVSDGDSIGLPGHRRKRGAAGAVCHGPQVTQGGTSEDADGEAEIAAC